MSDLVAALGLVLVIEGIVFALFPEGLKRKLIAALEMPASTLRIFGLAAAITGLAVVWMVRG
ncbi:MAG: DUF2065 domain-containing protein [Alphaproteobacteria bacterium]|jgi:uncharacterized protein|nr:DUF2065 domain-containing protein [Alphaproteobacteria bacterium]MBT4086556.1 DUF2065 domain-containing protein [Alphaproteobacteria bacterium]MBT4543116.1 DUF2065 domain-containing protein [Alphaproteobacteria bacterium]MBT7745328.1 DUF2065 domain-containing protein [Alphaproteobacteria bacterium]